MEYVSPAEIINADGLRIALVQYMPSPWGQAAKAMFEYKGLDFLAAPWEGGGANEEIVAWSGADSAPVVAFGKEKPITRWDDILFLIERLAPAKPLVPESREDRALMLGISHEICGELGLGWNRRLSLFRPVLESGQAPEGFVRMGERYGFVASDVEQADARQAATLQALAKRLEAQRSAGSNYFVGKGVTAVDFYWTAFCNIFAVLPPEQCAIPDQARPMFENLSDTVRAAIAPILTEHRDRMMAAHFKVPMEM